MISATNPRWTPSGLHRERTRVIRQSLYRVRARGSVVWSTFVIDSMPNGFRAVRWIQPSVQSSVVVRSRRRVAPRRVASPREKHDVSRASIVHDRASRASRSHTHLIMMYVRSVAMSCRKVPRGWRRRLEIW